MNDYELDSAYEIDGPDEARALYGKWAETYDTSFGDGWGYIAPREIARIFLRETDSKAAILDIGAGTGLVAEALLSEGLDGASVDGIDITPEMLEIAAKKNIYCTLIEGDLLAPLTMTDGSYGGVISCGTFTHGHVGPDCLPELFRVTRKGALFVCGTIPSVLDGAGFGSALAIHVAAGTISPVRFVDIPIYEGADHPHAGDRGLVMVFRRL